MACLLCCGVGVGLLVDRPVAARGVVRGHRNGAGAAPEQFHDLIVGGLPEVDIELPDGAEPG